MQKLKLKDDVIVLTGKDKGKTGSVMRLSLTQGKVWVKGLNLVKKTVKPTQESPNGGITDMESSLHISNVALLSPKTKKATRVRIEDRDGKKVRVSVSCGSIIE